MGQPVEQRVHPAHHIRHTTTSTRTACVHHQTLGRRMALQTLLPQVATARCCPARRAQLCVVVKGPVAEFLHHLPHLVCTLRPQ